MQHANDDGKWIWWALFIFEILNELDAKYFDVIKKEQSNECSRERMLDSNPLSAWYTTGG